MVTVQTTCDVMHRNTLPRLYVHVMEKTKGAEDYGRQIRAVVAFAAFGGLLALATIATGAWFALYVKDFVAIVEVYMRDVFCGYSALGVYLLLPVISSICGALCNDRRILLATLVLLIGLLVCEAGVGVFIYVRKSDVTAAILINLRLYACSRCTVTPYVDQTFACSISTSTVLNSDPIYITCSSHIVQWISVVFWAVLGFSAVRMAFEGLLLIMTLMLRHLLLLTPRKKNKVVPSTPETRDSHSSSDVATEGGVAGSYVALRRHASMD